MKILHELGSIKVFFVLAALLLLAFVLGGVIPQGLSANEYREMFGSVGGAWVTKFRLSNVFASPLFLALVLAAAANLLACTIKQWKIVKQRPGLFLSHLGVLLMFAGGAVHALFAQKGHLELTVGAPLGEFPSAKGETVKLPFDVELKEFKITYWDEAKHLVHAVRTGQVEPGHEGHGHGGGEELLESVEVKEGAVAHFKTEAPDLEIVKFYPEFTIGDKGPVSAGDAPVNPALAVRILDGRPAKKGSKPSYLFANHPDFHGMGESGGVRFVYEYRPGRVKQYESTVAFLEGGAEVFRRKISVNSPAKYKGYTLYQSGFDAGNMDYTSLQIAKDPSVWLIYAGFAIAMLGFTWAFRKEF